MFSLFTIYCHLMARTHARTHNTPKNHNLVNHLNETMWVFPLNAVVKLFLLVCLILRHFMGLTLDTMVLCVP